MLGDVPVLFLSFHSGVLLASTMALWQPFDPFLQCHFTLAIVAHITSKEKFIYTNVCGTYAVPPIIKLFLNVQRYCILPLLYAVLAVSAVFRRRLFGTGRAMPFAPLLELVHFQRRVICPE
jgi:hypothetical protein